MAKNKAKTAFIQIRVSPEDRERMDALAYAEHLDVSTWARRELLQAVEKWEARQLRVAERRGNYNPKQGKSDERK